MKKLYCGGSFIEVLNIYSLYVSQIMAASEVRLQLILFSKETGAFQFQTFVRFLPVPTTQFYCVVGTGRNPTNVWN